METVWIYTLSDPLTLKVKYVGKTCRINRRLNDHLKCTGRSKKDAWVKSLKNKNLSPILEILDIGDKKNCDLLEQYWISQFRAWGFELKNMTDGGDGSYGLIPWNKGLKGVFTHSEKSKLEMSKQRKGKHVGENNPMYGKKLSPETIKKQNNKKIGSKRSNEFKNKRTGEKNPNAKPVYCFTIDGVFVKKYECARFTVEDGFDWNIVSKVCRGINKTHKKHVFSFEEKF
jgi:group I intron endonuclease